MKCTMLENPSTTINKEFLPFFDLGNPKTKSMEISIQGLVGIGNGVYNPYGCTLDFVFYTSNALFTYSLHIPFNLWPIEMLMQYI